MAVLLPKKNKKTTAPATAPAPETAKKKIGRPKKNAEATSAPKDATAETPKTSPSKEAAIFLQPAQIGTSDDVPNFHKDHEPEAYAEGVAELVKSIKQNGLLNPISVRDSGGGAFVVVAGFKRTDAVLSILSESPSTFKKLFPKGVPCCVVSEDVGESRVLNLIENVNRTEIGIPTLIATAASLRDDCKLEPKDIARRAGKSVATVRQWLAIHDNLVDEAKELLNSGDLNMTDAAKIASMDKSEQLEVLKAATDDDDAGGADSNESAPTKKKLKDKVSEKKGGAVKPSVAQIKEAEEKLLRHAVKHSKTDKGGLADGKQGLYAYQHVLYAVSLGMSFTRGEQGDFNALLSKLKGIKREFSSSTTSSE